MTEDVEEIMVRVPQSKSNPYDDEKIVIKSKFTDWFSLSVWSGIWKQITSGVGFWGTFRPIIAVILSLVPFLYLGQHFNRKHQRGFDWTFLQIPLSFTLILWVLLFFWSIFDAWRDASMIVSENSAP